MTKAESEVFEYITAHGERLDSEIARDVGLPVDYIHPLIKSLSASGSVVVCKVTRFRDGKAVDGLLCRVNNYNPMSPRRPRATGLH